ncbi:MAG: hypothetical protein JWP97_4423 [Labilithrix sp.]|nr:hypothetical protein [Labilithrix sp.]
MMNASKALHSTAFTLSLVAASLVTACEIRTDDAADLNARVTEVTVVGTSVTSALYASGELGLTTIPKDAKGEAVLGAGLKVAVTLTSAGSLVTTTGDTECTLPATGDEALNVGVILDDSGSMYSSDPDKLRKSATVSFLNALGARDKVLLTDYGNSGDDLRDLLCVSQNGASCSPATAAFSSDKAALIKATEMIEDGGSTPLFESCAAMVPLVDSMKDGRRGMLLLSDGSPNSEDKRDACHAAAKAAQIPVFTVGLGPAAEGSEQVDASAVKVLRELSTATGGSYASANNPADLDALFRNMGAALAKGSCRTTVKIAGAAGLTPGTKITGEVTVGDNGAKASFELVTPAKE